MVRTVDQIPTSGRKPQGNGRRHAKMLRIQWGRIAMAEHLVLEFRNEDSDSAFSGEANRKEDEKTRTNTIGSRERVVAKN